MLKFYDSVDVPEWAICCLMNGDVDNLSDDEVNCIKDYLASIIKTTGCKSVEFDTEVMDEEKYGNYYRSEINGSPAFGREFGACTTWKLPVFIEVDDDICNVECFDVIVSGKPYFSEKHEVHMFNDMVFEDKFEAELWADAYFQHLERGFNVIIEKSGNIQLYEKYERCFG